MKFVSFGEILWDIIDGKEHLGGAPFNLAAHLARCGVESFMISSLGDDDLGRRALREMDRLAVDAAYVRIDPEHPTGTVDVTLSEAGQPSYCINENAAYDFIAPTEEQIDAVSAGGFHVFCFGTLAQRSETTRSALRELLSRFKGAHVFCDINLRQDYYSKELVKHSLASATILKLNDEEVGELSMLLRGECLSLKVFSEMVSEQYNLDLVIVTRGEKGCVTFREGRYREHPGKSVRVADAVGAGDAFSAAFLYKFCAEGDPAEAARVANELGAFVASRRGAIPDYTEDIKTVLRS